MYKTDKRLEANIGLPSRADISVFTNFAPFDPPLGPSSKSKRPNVYNKQQEQGPNVYKMGKRLEANIGLPSRADISVFTNFGPFKTPQKDVVLKNSEVLCDGFATVS